MNGSNGYYEPLDRVIREVGMDKGRMVAVRVAGSTQLIHLTFTRSTEDGTRLGRHAQPSRTPPHMTLDQVLDKVQQAVVEFVAMHTLPFGKFKFIVKDGRVQQMRRIENVLNSENPAPAKRTPRVSKPHSKNRKRNPKKNSS